jgi:colicin import membrane protein
MVAQEQARL